MKLGYDYLDENENEVILNYHINILVGWKRCFKLDEIFISLYNRIIWFIKSYKRGYILKIRNQIWKKKRIIYTYNKRNREKII